MTNDVVLGKGLNVKAGNDLTFSTGAVSLGNAANIFTIGNNNTTFGGIISDGGGSGAGSIDKQGAGTLILSGANTYSGGTTLSAGTLGIGVDSVVSGGHIISGALGTGTLTVATGTLQVPDSAGVPHTLANNIVINTALTVYNGLSLTLNGVISGAGKLIEDMC